MPGKPHESLVVERIQSSDPDILMPPPDFGKPLTPEQKDLITQWIAAGAVWSKHWSFEPIRRPVVPAARPDDEIRNPIDNFVLTRLAEHNVTESPAADRTTLIRRVYLDLLGLPPSINDVDEFLADKHDDAYERLLDRVLDNPHFGERWGRHWLDQARYADSHGYTIDNDRSMWPYRDWVIDAFNRDLPFDQFTIEQLAGDLIPEAELSQKIATGFHRNTLINTEGGTKADQFRDEQVKDRVDTTGLVWMGLTVGCAKCHTHKFDPITQHEYYQIYAFFNSTADENSVEPTVSLPSSEQVHQIAELESQQASLQQQMEGKKDAELAALQASLARVTEALAALNKSVPTTMILQELPAPRKTYLQVRGDFLRTADEVPATVPAVLPPLSENDSSRTRLDFARWLTSSEHPLTARVRVNRIWMRLFGRGLVETENDLGIQGSLPSHPELLDWLADDFREQGWSQKKLIRLIMNSATYRRSSAARPELAAIDSRNQLLARQNRLRVEAEIVRDLALSVSGRLSEKIGGPSVYPPQEEGVYAFTQTPKDWKTSNDDDRWRRGMYTYFYRSAPYPMLATFDVPKFNTTCTQRDRSNTPLQSLTIANSEAIFELAGHFGRRIQSDGGNTDESRLQFAFRTCFARPPGSREAEMLMTYLNQSRKRLPDEETTWTAVARLLINLDEFITRE